MKILFLVTSLNSGGIENYLLRFLRHYDHDITPVVLCKSGEFGDLQEEYASIQNIQLLKTKLGFFNFGAYRDFQTYLEEEKFHAVCDFTGNFAGLVMRGAAKAGIENRISFYRGSTNRFAETIFKRAYNTWMNTLVLKYATSILSNSEAAFTYFFKMKDNRFQVIYNGINASQFDLKISQAEARKELNIPENAFVVGHTGRAHYSKNHATLIEVASILCKKYSDIYFAFAGKNTGESFNDLLKEKDLTEKLFLLGYQGNIPMVLKSFDLFFFPSVTEGQPNALIEAMVSGLPFVASDITPIKETVPKVNHDLLFSPQDVDAFATKIEQFYLKQWKNDPQIMPEVKDKFNAEKRFGEFFEILIK